MSIQAAWNSMLRAVAIGAGAGAAKKISEKPEPTPKGPSDAEVYHALAEQRGTMLQQEIQQRREAEMASMRAQEAAQEEDRKPQNTLQGAMERIQRLREAAPADLDKAQREERIRSALAAAFGVKEGEQNG